MTSHALHPSIPGAVLYDDCPRCADYAFSPDMLDDDSLRALVEIETPVTAADALALGQMFRAVRLARRVLEVQVVSA